MPAWVYILARDRNGTLYIGVTSNLVKRVHEHKEKVVDGFTSKYDVKKLVYFEEAAEISAAILREKQLKKWNRAWKIRLIEERNPYWNGLFDTIV